MNYHDANNIRDLRAAGADMPESLVNQALELTGDMDLDAMQALIGEAA